MLPGLSSADPLPARTLDTHSVSTPSWLNVWPCTTSQGGTPGSVFWVRPGRLQEAQRSMVLLPRLCSFRCCFCESALPSSAEAPTWGVGGGAESQRSCAWLLRAARGGWRPQHPALPGASWLGSQPCGVRAAAHQPASWHRARDASQPGEEAAWLSASSRCPSCQPGGRPETPAP